MEKIEAVGIRGNLALWFQNYLQNRKQPVVIKGKKSEYKTGGGDSSVVRAPDS